MQTQAIIDILTVYRKVLDTKKWSFPWRILIEQKRLSQA